VSNFCPAIAVPITVKMPEPITAPIPRAVRETGPSVFLSLRSGSSESEIRLSMDLQQKSWLSDVRIETRTVFSDGPDAGSGKRLMSPEVLVDLDISKGTQPANAIVRLPATCQVRFYRFAVPRASFFTFRFCDPRAYSRGLSGCSVLCFLRAVRLAFLRSSLVKVAVFAMSAFLKLVIW
jgi:hypothetical protein